MFLFADLLPRAPACICVCTVSADGKKLLLLELRQLIQKQVLAYIIRLQKIVACRLWLIYYFST
jgi:hypothetical protein